MLSSKTELTEYHTATALAKTFELSTGRIQDALRTIAAETERLSNDFGDNYGFRLDAYTNGSHHTIDELFIADLKDNFTRAAWRVLIDKLEIRKVMSVADQRKMDDQLSDRPTYRRRNGSDADNPVPEITAETIIGVLAAFVSDADGYLERMIAEEFDYWRPRLSGPNRHKTNERVDRLNRKVIKPYAVERYWNSTRYHARGYDDKHMLALDTIFSSLDGKGPVREHKGPLVSALETSEDGCGETEYFRFKCYRNGNLHLEFKRLDLLERFNQIAGNASRLGKAVA